MRTKTPYFTSSRNRMWPFPVLILGSLILINGCHRFQPPFRDPQVSKTELRYGKSAFTTYFRAGGTGPLDTIKQSNEAILWSDLDQKMAVLMASDAAHQHRTHGVTVIYGLKKSGTNAKYEFTCGIQLIAMDSVEPDIWNIVADSANFYTIENDKLKLNGGDPENWPPANVYAQNLLLQRNAAHKPGEPWVKFLQGFDTRKFTFQWENELKTLQNDNKDSAKYLSFINHAEPLIANDSGYFNLRHHLCAVLLDVNKHPLIDDNKAGPQFRRKGADIGSPCPTICAVAYFPAHGIPEMH